MVSLSEITKKENIRFEYIYGSWSEGLERIKTGEIDILTSAAYTRERSLFMDYSETHHGLFDISMIRNIPEFEFFAPSNGEELRDLIYYAWKHSSGPIAIRYPGGSSHTENLNVKEHNEFIPGRIKILTKGNDAAVFAMGDMVQILKQF